MGRLNNLTGKRFGRLFVVAREGTNKHKKPLWKCHCDCGNEVIVISQSLTGGRTTSCGCLRVELASKLNLQHGMSGTRFHDIWITMRRRCSDEKFEGYEYYGGRGISVVDRWKDFENFKEDMYESYVSHTELFGNQNTTIDRIDVNGDYCLENCRWATYETQNRNTRIREDSRTGVKGVCYVERDKKYTAYISVNKKFINLGYFDTIEQASKARQDAEELYWN